MKNGDIEDSTKETYHTIWLGFLRFLDGFKDLPKDWEQKMVMYAAHLGNTGNQAPTVSSYMSAIKYKLKKDGVIIPDKNFEIASIIRTCKIKNNAVFYRCGINKPMMKNLVAILKKDCNDKGQEYLFKLYRAMFWTAYYGMFRISELTESKHALKFQDMKEAINKRKFLCILRSAKNLKKSEFPHTVHIPQIVDIQEGCADNDPYIALSEYKAIRPDTCKTDNFFTFADGTPVTAYHYRKVLQRMLLKGNYNTEIFDCHSARVGRASDLLNSGVPFFLVKKWGNWKSDNSILKYFKF